MALFHNNILTAVCVAALLALQYHYFSQVVGNYKLVLQTQYFDHQPMAAESRKENVVECNYSNPSNLSEPISKEKEKENDGIESGTMLPLDESLFLPLCNNASKASWIECAPVETTIDVFLTVYKRENLVEQLTMIASQTVLPSAIWVIQNEDHQNVEHIIKAWNSEANITSNRLPSNLTSSWPENRPPLYWLHFHYDSMYHSRFHAAYMLSSARYISLWDDDLSVGAGWLEHVIEFLKSQNDTAIVSGKGRIVQELPWPSNDYEVVYIDREKLVREPLVWNGGTAHAVDFTVQHHTLRRELLKLYLGATVYTYASGEDIQMNFALQRHGIPSYSLARHKNLSLAAWASADNGMGSNGPHASWKKKPQEPRLWLICKLAQDGYRLPNCENCNTTVIQECLDHFEKTGSTMRHRRRRYRERQRSAGEMTLREIALQYIRQQ